MRPAFPSPGDKAAQEEGRVFTPKFDASGLIVCITTEAASGDVLMVAYMNAEALDRTLSTGIVHYWSRSKGALWRKGDTSGQVQNVVEIRTDCDQDALLIAVTVGGDGKACHTGRRSCFYRRIVPDGKGYALETREEASRDRANLSDLVPASLRTR